MGEMAGSIPVAYVGDARIDVSAPPRVARVRTLAKRSDRDRGIFTVVPVMGKAQRRSPPPFPTL